MSPSIAPAARNLQFGIGTAGQDHLLDGWLLESWAQPEDGFAWALGPESRFTMGALPGAAMLELDVNPFVLPGSTVGQRLAVLVDGVQIGEDRVRGEGTLGYRLPAGVRPGSGSVVTLRMPDAARPAKAGLNDDRRLLGFMLRSAAWRPWTPMPPVPGRILPPLALGPGRTQGRWLQPCAP